MVVGGRWPILWVAHTAAMAEGLEGVTVAAQGLVRRHPICRQEEVAERARQMGPLE